MPDRLSPPTPTPKCLWTGLFNRLAERGQKADLPSLGAPKPSAPANAVRMTLTSKHHVGLGQSQVVTKGEGCVL